MKSLSRFLMACSLIFATAQVAFATTVERFRPYAVDVPAEASQTWSGALTADSQAGAYGKTGGGELTFPLGSVMMRNAFNFNLWEGSLKLTDDGTSPSIDTTTPPAVMNEASLWLEAGRNYGWKDQSAGTVEYWYDRREASVGGTSYPRAKAVESNMQDSGLKGVYYAKAQTAADGKVELNFNGLGNTGSTMLLLAKDNSRASFAPVTLMAVYNNSNDTKLGNLFGSDKTANACHYQQGGTVFFNGGNCTLQVFSGRFFKDGRLCDPSKESVGTGRHLIEWESGSSTATAFNALFDDRGYAGRSGGEGLCELLVFTRHLSDAERLEVEEYLLQKWTGAARAPSYEVKTAVGSELAYDANTATVLETTKVTGKGVLAKSGDGNLAIPLGGSSDLSEFDGQVRVGEGSATVETATLDYAFKDGDTVTFDVDASATADYDKIAVTHGAAGAANVVTVNGDASVKVSGAFPSGVDTLKFTGRELVLADSVVKADDFQTGAPVEVEIKDAGFEGLMSGADFKQWGVGTYGGWTISGGDNQQWTSIFRPQGSGTQTWFADHLIPPPEGEYALGISKNSSFSTSVVLPTDGVYELTFFTSSRVSYGGGTFEMSLIDKDNVETIFGHVTCVYCNGWVPRRFSTGFVKAGTYTLKFKGLTTADCCSHFDAFKMFRVSDRKNSEVVAVPNGNFNLSKPDANLTERGLGFGVANTADGWTLTQTASGADARNTDVAVVLNGGIHYNALNADGGNGMLSFYGNGGTATREAFTVPAGTYRLTAKAAVCGVNYSFWRCNTRCWDPNFAAKLSINGKEMDLGTTGSVSTHLMTKVRFPNVITLDGTETLTLSVSQTVATSGNNFAAGQIDDFAFERVSDDVTIANADFEADDSKPTGWSLTTFSDSTDNFMKNSNGFVRDVSTEQWKGIYGDDVANGCGARVMFLVQKAQIAQSITFPCAGRYRLSFWTHARPNYGGNAIHAFLADSNGAMIKDIGTTPAVYSSKFFKQSFVFEVTSAECANPVRLVLKGVNGTGSLISRDGNGGNRYDANIALDGVAISRVTSVADFSIGENVELKLAANTKLRLDFEGERTVKTLKIGGKRLVGTIDASHESGLVSGSGKLIGKPSTMGLFIVVQ